MSVEAMSLTAAPSSTSAVQGGRPTATIRYCDQVDVAEVFADSITNILVDAQLMRIEFGITRLDEMKENAPITGRRYPACRLVLSSAATLELINRLRHVASLLAQTNKATPPSEAPKIAPDEMPA